MKTAAKVIGLVMAAWLTLLGTSPQLSAGSITSLSSSGPGGTVPLLKLDLANSEVIQYQMVFTQSSIIVLHISVDSPGEYYLGLVPLSPFIGVGNFTNSTGSDWASFDIQLLGASSGARVGKYGWFSSDFTEGIRSTPTSLHFTVNSFPSGKTSQNTGLSVIIEGAGPQFFQVLFRPSDGAVPEPSSLALGGVAALAGALMFRRRRF